MSKDHIPTIDENVIRKAQKADTEAFSQIYNAYYNNVYFIAYQYYKNEESAKDIVQEVFIRVHNKIDTLKEPKAFSSWISKITYHTCINYNRSKLKTVDLGEKVTVEDFIDNNRISISDELEDKRIKEIIMESLESMTTPLKSVGLLRYYEDFKIDEIAEILDLPSGTVNSRISRIREKLQQDLKRNGISPKNYSIVVVPSTISLAYQMLSTNIVLGSENANELFDKIVNSKTLITSGILLKLALGTAATATVIAGVLIFNEPDTRTNVEGGFTPIVIEKPMEDVEEPIIDTAKFVDIKYSTVWTNSIVYLDITTTNDNYDQILVNGLETRNVNENGVYNIQLIQGDTIVDHRVIEITNIDNYSPNATYSQNGNTFTYYLSDDLSQINPGSIRFFKNDISSMDYDYNEQTNTLTIVSVGDSVDKFYISDYAGNELEIIILEE
ncbi:RNA polymerase sigma factor [Breznakia pachnodae]|uniref:RNA polymerase sigma factor (Sigma-70 family) n=1 Tax=Breznakia pachnodae TaxID=265178 RepID=A0ABU0DYW3_9FIRM|nr:RNA polymerase sigma factor [Breznakia pachnodae]MDQ0359834.1 RNA polymerase sigma factor (sigma-70 family) [Breznakia pachnodae]